MMSRQTTYNLLLSVLMMISLIIAPVFAMPAHHSLGMMMPVTPVTATAPMDSHHAMPDMSQASHASTQTTSHCSDTAMSQDVMSDDTHCASMDSMDNCQHCNGQHCQYSTLTTLFTALTNHFQHPQPATWLADALLTRQERALRPPIHA